MWYASSLWAFTVIAGRQAIKMLIYSSPATCFSLPLAVRTRSSVVPELELRPTQLVSDHSARTNSTVLTAVGAKYTKSKYTEHSLSLGSFNDWRSKYRITPLNTVESAEMEPLPKIIGAQTHTVSSPHFCWLYRSNREVRDSRYVFIAARDIGRPEVYLIVDRNRVAEHAGRRCASKSALYCI